MLFSSAAGYGLRAVLKLARSASNTPVAAAEIAAAESIPLPFLAKIMRDMARAGLVESVKGPGGGYRLAKPATEICVLDVVRVVDDVQAPTRQCVLGLSSCSDARPCPFHPRWKPLREQFMQEIGKASLAEFAKMAKADGEPPLGGTPFVHPMEDPLC